MSSDHYLSSAANWTDYVSSVLTPCMCCPHSDENEDVPDTHGAIVPYSESKLAIEQMVMKETFTR